jgi:hypothetical protein
MYIPKYTIDTRLSNYYILVGGAMKDYHRRFRVLYCSQRYTLTRILIPPAFGNLVDPPLSQASTSAAAPRPSLYHD